MEPLYIILMPLILIIVLLAIFTDMACLFPGVFHRTAVAQAIQALQGKKRK